MPLVAATVLAYAAGLLSGFTDGEAALLGAAVIGFAAWQVGRNARDRILICAIGVAGAGVAMVASSTNARCTANMLRAAEWRVTLAADAEPGALIIVRSDCGSAARIAIRHGHAFSGAGVIARGKPILGRGGPILLDACVAQNEAP